MAKLKLTDKLCDDICNDIKAGVPIDHAAIAHGITRVTFYNWYNKGKEAKSGKFRQFHDKVEEAKSVAITLRARRIYKAGETSWQADAWWLERVDPTQKPVKLLADILKDYSEEGINVLDLFGGSGSTLIACEQLNRQCYMMELDPYYCQVIINRWEEYTGQKAEKLPL